FKRDVIKADKQDDLAAVRLFSAATLRHQIKHHPEHLGSIIYHFVFGELCDAWQSRKVHHAERIRMSWRGWFFLQEWRNFLRKAGYREDRHLIIRQAVDITNKLVTNLLILILIHRDHLQSNAQPFLPWMHGTEANEHFFGVIRSQIPDFNYADFIYSAVKTSLLISGTYREGTTTAANARASGYHHTCHVDEGVPISRFIQFPTDAEIQDEIDRAAEEATSLIQALGYTFS
ncbi:hypothetical protein SISNIDRAFT_391589, partial [Sistotremastrum niveocremeum HHB9708]